MKNRILLKSVWAVASSACLVYPTANAAEDAASNSETTTKVAPITESAAPKARVRLSPPAGEVLKLAQAKISEGTIVAFIINSGYTYNLSVAEIIYLREQGVSDFVLTTMLDQGRRLAEKSSANAAPTVAMSFTNAVRTAPLVPSAGTVYSVPDSVPGYYYDDYNGYYPDYGYYWGPGWSIDFGFPGRRPLRGGPPIGGMRGGGPGGGGHALGAPGGGRGGAPGGGGIGGGGLRGGGAPGGGISGGGPGGGGPSGGHGGGPGGGGGGGGRGGGPRG